MTTKEEIQTSINSRLTTKATKIEGGTIQDIIGSISYELANIIDTKIETILDNAFIVSADEIYLELKGRELNIIRKPASYALLDSTFGIQYMIAVTPGIICHQKSGISLAKVEGSQQAFV